MVSNRQRQRNLENIQFVRSLLSAKREQRSETEQAHRKSETRSERDSLEETQGTDPGA